MARNLKILLPGQPSVPTVVDNLCTERLPRRWC